MRPFAAIVMGGLCWLSLSGAAQAQVAWVTYYQPTTVFSPAIVSPAPVVQTATVVSTPQTVTVLRTPQTVFYAPTPTVAVAPAPTVAYQPVARVQTRFRPILGGTVSRVRYGYAPVLVQPAPVVMAW